MTRHHVLNLELVGGGRVNSRKVMLRDMANPIAEDRGAFAVTEDANPAQGFLTAAHVSVKLADDRSMAITQLRILRRAFTELIDQKALELASAEIKGE